MAALAIAAVGSGIGGAIGGSFLGVAASSWGYMIGSVIGSMLFGPEGQDQEGPRLKDSTYSGEVEGTDMPILWGGDRLPGKPIWIKNPPREVRKKEESGGKGGGGGSSYTSFSYFQDLALCFGEFVCQRPRRVWANQELIYDASGANTETSSSGFSFSWYDGTDEGPDSVVEGDVGAGNSPAYLGRCVMVIQQLPLSEKYGNRIPVIEAELQTTGSLGTNITSYNLGDVYPSVSSMTGVRDIIRHPTKNEVLATPWTNSNGYGVPVLRADMANQYTEHIWTAPNSVLNDIIWFSDPYEYNPGAVDSFLASEYFSNTGGTIYQVEYPQGKILRAVYPSYYGGARIWAESHAVAVVHVRNLGGSFKFLDKWLFTLSSAYAESTIIEAGLNNGDYAEQWCCINYFENRFGFFGKNVDHNDRWAYWNLNYIPLGLDPTGSRVSEPFYDYFGADDHVNWAFESTRPVCIEENEEIFIAVDNLVNSSMGVMIIDSESGDVKHWYDFVASGDTSASSYWGIGSGYPHLHYDPNQRRIWWSLSGTGDVGNIHVDTRNVEWYPASSAANAWAVSYPNRNTIWSAAIENSGVDWVWKERRLGLVNQGTIALSVPAAAIMEKCGLSPTEYDVSALTGISVGSFVHGTRHSGRADLEVILGIAQADAVQSDYKIKIVARGGATDVVIPEDDLGAQEVSREPKAKDPVTLTLPMETEVPKVFEVQYRSSNNAYTQGIAQSYIATGTNIARKTAQLPLALSDQQASEVCERYHQQMIDPQTFRFDLPVKYMFYEPGDVVEVPKGGENHRVRLTQTDRGANWIMQCTGILDNAEDQTATAVAPGVDEFLGTIQTQQIPTRIILDGPLLRDSDLDHPGPYLTSYVYNPDFPPATWHYSVDNSVFGELAAQIAQPGAGVVQGTYNTSVWEDWDDISQIVVNVSNDATWSSSTKSAIEADPTINAFAYGRPGRWEYFNAATVTLTSSSPNKVYTLSNLLRGRRGTDNYIGSHEDKDYLIALDETGFYRSILQNSQIGNTIFYRQSTNEIGVADVESTIFSVDGGPLKPYSPIQIEGTPHTTTVWAASTAYALNDEVVPTTGNSRRYVCTTAGTSGGTEPTWNTTIDGTQADNTVTWTVKHELDFDASWTRRTRRGGSLGGDNTLTDNVGGPLNEESKEYEIDIVNKSTGSVIRTETGLTTEAYEYLGVDQESDGTDDLGKFYMDVYQVSQTVGRGFRGRGEYDRGWPELLNAFLDTSPDRLFILDDADGSTALEYISKTSPGTYTSASQADAVQGDDVKSLKGDGSGYMKTGTTLRDVTTGKAEGTVVMFGTGDIPYQSALVEITQGGSANRCQVLYKGGGQWYYRWAFKAGSGGVADTTSGFTEHGRGRMWMFGTTAKTHGTGMNFQAYINGAYADGTSGGTGHSTYASSFQNQTRNTSYNDTIGGSHAASPANILSTGALGFVAVYDRVLTSTEFAALWAAAKYSAEKLYTEDNACIDYARFEDASNISNDNPLATVKGTWNWYDNGLGQLQGAIRIGPNFSSNSGGSTASAYKTIPAEWKIQTFSIDFWLKFNTAASGTQYLCSIGPRDWNGSVKKGLHVYNDAVTNGLTVRVGDGGASFTDYADGALALTGTTSPYHVCITVDATNGIKGYINGVEVLNSSGTTHTIDWTDAGSGNPSVGTAYISGKNSASSSQSTSDSGVIADHGGFGFWTKELSSSEILAIYNRGAGVTT